MSIYCDINKYKCLSLQHLQIFDLVLPTTKWKTGDTDINCK